MKNIVICCDGTNNQLETDPTNVMRLYSVLVRDPARQVTYYDPGVGTLSQPGLNGAAAKRLSLVYGLAFGLGFTRNLEEAYRFLMWNYEPGDRVFMFGFSRGAFTVRALAGMVDMFGLLDREQENLLPYVSRAYKAANFHVANRFKNLAQRKPPIDFLGVWDTVSSLGFLYKRKTLPNTANNASVHVIRHALAIDERRAYFRQNSWGNRFAAQQDIKQVWFPGVHSDVGGGYAKDDNDLALIAFEWMVAEASRPGPHTELLIDEAKYWKLLIGEDEYAQALAENRPPVFKPNAAARAHESLTGPWWVAEFVPMNYTLRRREFFWPLGHRRHIDENARVHQSVLDRMQTYGDEYRPPNLGRWGSVEPWSSDAGKPVAAPPEDFWTRLWRALSAGGSVFIAGYVVILLLFLVGVLARHFSAGNESSARWWQQALNIVGWPYPLWQWLDEPAHFWGAAYLAAPLVALGLGSWLLNRFTKLPYFQQRVHGKILHERWRGYSRLLAQEQFNALGDDGRAAYLRALVLDCLNPIIYGLALHWSLVHVRHIAGDVLPLFVSLLPLVPMLADWVENFVLYRQLKHHHDHVQAGAIRLASIATMVKFASFAILLLALAGLVVWAWWPDFVIRWLGQPHHPWGALLLGLPLAAFAVGTRLIGWLSRMPQFAERVEGKLMHLRVGGYNRQLVRRQLNELGQDGRAAYATSLWLDFFFPLLYGPALLWSLAEARHLWSDTVPAWLTWLPVVTVLADWIENSLLISQIHRYPNRLQDMVIRIASGATIVKIASFAVSALLLFGLIAWVW